MKVLSVQQPWAHLIAEGLKDVENRGRGTSHRGDLVIQVSSTWRRDDVVDTITRLAEAGLIEGELDLAQLYSERGHAIAVVELFDVSSGVDSPWAVEGAHHWRLRNTRRIDPQIKLKGALSLIECPGDIVEAIARSLRGAEARVVSVGSTTLKGLSREQVQRCDVRVVPNRPHGSLPMDIKFVVQVRDPKEGAELYDSAALAEDRGRFDTEAGAHAHAKAWQEAQEARLGEVGLLRMQRRTALPGRLDEVDRGLAVVNAAAKRAGEGRKMCAQDHKKLRDEAREPRVEVVWSGDGFTTAAAASLSEQTDRPWYGADLADGEMLLPPLGAMR